MHAANKTRQGQPSRDKIIAANPLVGFLQSRGHTLRGRSEKFVTNACPLTEHNKRNHTCVTVDPRKQVWHCNDCNVGGSVIDWLMLERGIGAVEAMRILGGNCTTRMPRTEEAAAFDWGKCVAAFSDKRIERLARWRGYTNEFVRWLKENSLTGIYDGKPATPVVQNGSVVGAHYRLKDGRWLYFPTGIHTQPLVIGELIAGERVNVFESTFDGFAYLDKSGERDGVIIARGSGNAKLAAARIPQGSTAYVFTQNDKGGSQFEKALLEKTQCAVRRVKIPAPHKDLNDWTRDGATAKDLLEAMENAETLREAEKTGEREPRIRFFSPSQLRDYRPDKDIVLVGDCAVMRGETYVLAGPPSVGKSLGGTQLAVSGATLRDWFGLKVHCQFRTMIVQTENGRYRLKQEFSALDCDELENFIRVSEPPPFGLTLTNEEFKEDIKRALDSFKPENVIFDPWNAAAKDDKVKEYAETFDALRSLLPTGPDKPALGIIAHTRKPQPNEKRTGGTALMHLLAGSYILTSVPRCIFVMTSGNPQDETDDSVVFFNPKNSNGENVPRSAWHRKLGGFTPATDFDWNEFDKVPEQRKTIRLDHIREVFADGKKRLDLKEAAHDLATLANVTDSAAYNALKPDGKFAEYISRSNGMLSFHSTKFPNKSR